MESGKFYRSPTAMEPMFPSNRESLRALSLDLIAQSATLVKALHPTTLSALSELLSKTNCYYSNLIEGHNTYPIEIDRALAGDYADDPAKRALQLESLAHLEVQKLIANKLKQNQNLVLTNKSFLCWVHKAFYQRMPGVYKTIMHPKTGIQHPVNIGKLRTSEVKVGHHIPPSFRALDQFMDRFNEAYQLNLFARQDHLVLIAASHHRLAWIHPFTDGNGRVIRLFSDALMHQTRLQGYGLWTVSRGLARSRKDYMQALANADKPRQGDYDGRGNLSEKGLHDFCEYFLATCLDQVSFMQQLLQLDALQKRINGYIRLRHSLDEPENPRLKLESGYLLNEALLHGELPRSEVQRVSGLGERTARGVVSQLLKEGLLNSMSNRGPLTIGFPAKVVPYYFPKLYPGNAVALL